MPLDQTARDTPAGSIEVPSGVGDRLDEFTAYRQWRAADVALQAYVAANPLPLGSDVPAWSGDQRRGFARVVQAEVDARCALDEIRGRAGS